MAKDRNLEFLANVSLFSGLNKKELGLISRVSEVAKAPAGAVIVDQGAAGHEFYLLLAGNAVVRRSGRKIASLEPGHYFGEMALLDRGPRSATVIAETDVELLIIGRREFLGVMNQVPAVAHKLLVAMAARLRDSDNRAYSH